MERAKDSVALVQANARPLVVNDDLRRIPMVVQRHMSGPAISQSISDDVRQCARQRGAITDKKEGRWAASIKRDLSTRHSRGLDLIRDKGEQFDRLSRLQRVGMNRNQQRVLDEFVHRVEIKYRL